MSSGLHAWGAASPSDLGQRLQKGMSDLSGGRMPAWGRTEPAPLSAVCVPPCHLSGAGGRAAGFSTGTATPAGGLGDGRRGGARSSSSAGARARGRAQRRRWAGASWRAAFHSTCCQLLRQGPPPPRRRKQAAVLPQAAASPPAIVPAGAAGPRQLGISNSCLFLG